MCKKKELAFTLQMIQEDVRNNSVWNYRHWLLEQGAGDWEGELDFVVDWIKKSPNNISTWSFYSSALKKHFKAQNLASLCDHFDAFEVKPVNYLSFLVDMQAEGFIEKQKAIDACEALVKSDEMRSKYWHHCLCILQKK